MHERKRPEYACLLAFDVPINKEAEAMARELNVQMFSADIIYHLFDKFTAHMDSIREQRKKEAASIASFPVVLKIVPGMVFSRKDPIIMGMEVIEGTARVGTHICIPTKDFIDIGKIHSMELTKGKQVDKADKGDKVAVKIQATMTIESSRMFGRHFDEQDEFVSRVTRHSIDLLKEHFRKDLSIEDWRLLARLKKMFEMHYNEIM